MQSYDDTMPTTERTYPRTRLSGTVIDLILRDALAEGQRLYADFTKDLFPRSGGADDDLFRSLSPYSLPERSQFHGYITSGDERERYGSPAAFALALATNWDSAAFDFETGLFTPMTVNVNCTEGFSRVIVGATDEGTAASLLAIADESLRPPRWRRWPWPRQREMRGLVNRRRWSLVFRWVGGVLTALLVAYLVFILGWQ